MDDSYAREIRDHDAKLYARSIFRTCEQGIGFMQAYNDRFAEPTKELFLVDEREIIHNFE